MEGGFVQFQTPIAKDGIVAFVAIGIAFFQFVTPLVTTPSALLRHEQLMGTAELLFATPHKPAAIFTALSLPAIVLGSLQVLFYYGFLYGLVPQALPHVSLLYLLIIFGLALVFFQRLGWLLCNLVLLYQGTNLHSLFTGSVIMILSGVYFDTRYLPGPLTKIAECLPFKHFLDLIRHFSGLSERQLTKGEISFKFTLIIVFTIVAEIVAQKISRKALRLAKKWGTLKVY
jgi:ABC-2 type transport system permease protein